MNACPLSLATKIPPTIPVSSLCHETDPYLEQTLISIMKQQSQSCQDFHVVQSRLKIKHARQILTKFIRRKRMKRATRMKIEFGQFKARQVPALSRALLAERLAVVNPRDVEGASTGPALYGAQTPYYLSLHLPLHPSPKSSLADCLHSFPWTPCRPF